MASTMSELPTRTSLASAGKCTIMDFPKPMRRKRPDSVGLEALGTDKSVAFAPFTNRGENTKNDTSRADAQADIFIAAPGFQDFLNVFFIRTLSLYRRIRFNAVTHIQCVATHALTTSAFLIFFSQNRHNFVNLLAIIFSDRAQREGKLSGRFSHR